MHGLEGAAPHRPSALRDRLPLVAGLGAVIALAWVYLLAMGWGMQHMEVGADMLLMPRMTDWGALDLALVFLMWAVMMVAMMLPSALPMLWAFHSVPAPAPLPRLAAFVAGYLAVWVGFSLVMTLLQWALLEAHWVSPMMEIRNPRVGGVLLVAAGLFQFTPLKRACLSRCRSPLAFIMTEWRAGVGGAWAMGLRHGLMCTGCCWLLMALLFLLGVMNVVWIAALTLFVLVEKTWPSARGVSAASGLVLAAWGAWLLVVG